MSLAIEVEESLKAKFEALLPHLDERQRRLTLGAGARSLGHGGIAPVARAAGLNTVTIAKGVAELEAGGDPLGRARRPGGGRKPQTATDPGLVKALLALVEPEERGDPMGPLRWTTKSTRALAAELTRAGHPVSAWTVANLLHEQGFSLQGNSKQVEGTAHPDRDAQFRYLNDQSAAHMAAGQLVISVAPTRTWARPTRMASRPMTAGSRSAPTMTRRRLRWRRFAAGTARSARTCTPVRRNC